MAETPNWRIHCPSLSALVSLLLLRVRSSHDVDEHSAAGIRSWRPQRDAHTSRIPDLLQLAALIAWPRQAHGIAAQAARPSQGDGGQRP
jgi:hypothetical protein